MLIHSSGLRVHEQKQTDRYGPLRKALRDVMGSGWPDFTIVRLYRLTRKFKNFISTQHEIMRSFLQPPVQLRLEESVDLDNRNTVVDHAIKTLRANGEHPDVGFVDDVVANLKLLLRAGLTRTSLSM